eukprot:CAMPEP_0184737710 /NCGR_PEP_ID=MMETSP0315-20130426/481_1 /TAXON_ID=101924 /ORGANISM="Rhodosorus marinus, Strain UTEX LB 2760" /LENGTH=33 /DNA_ID= /DNA_START= /DNA_END= /DNA_ORIENTATION=
MAVPLMEKIDLVETADLVQGAEPTAFVQGEDAM